MRDMMNILYTNRRKNGEYILELLRMKCLYLGTGLPRRASLCSPFQKLLGKIRMRKREHDRKQKIFFAEKILIQQVSRATDTPSVKLPFLDVLLQHVFDPRLRNSSYNLVDRLPVFEHEQGGNSHDIEPT
jgi:hypothetical protein